MRSMISIPGSLFFVMSSAPAKNYAGDARCVSQDPSIQRCPIQSRLRIQVRIRSAFFLRRTQISINYACGRVIKTKEKEKKNTLLKFEKLLD